MPKLRALFAQGGRHQGAESAEQSKKGDDDERGAHTAWNAPPLESIDARRDGDGEQDAEKDGEEQRVGEPDQSQEQVHREDERGRPDDVPAAPADRAIVPHVAAPDVMRRHLAALVGVGRVRGRVAGGAATQVERGISGRIAHTKGEGM